MRDLPLGRARRADARLRRSDHLPSRCELPRATPSTTATGPGLPADRRSGQSGLEAQYELRCAASPASSRSRSTRQGNLVWTTSTTAPTPGDTFDAQPGPRPRTRCSTKALDNQISCAPCGLRRNPGAVAGAWGAGGRARRQTGPGPRDHARSRATTTTSGSAAISEANYKALQTALRRSRSSTTPIDGLQPPGSTFKLATATAALDDGLITPGYYVDRRPGLRSSLGRPDVCTTPSGEVLRRAERHEGAHGLERHLLLQARRSTSGTNQKRYGDDADPERGRRSTASASRAGSTFPAQSVRARSTARSCEREHHQRTPRPIRTTPGLRR